MKNYKRFTLRLLPFLTFVLFFTSNSCEKLKLKDKIRGDTELSDLDEKCGNSNSNSNGSNPVITPCGTPSISNLIAGQNTDIGSVTIYNNGDSLFIDIVSVGNWWMSSVSAYVGSLSGMPQTSSGNPQVGLFPLKKTLNPKKQMVRLARPLAGLPPCFIVAVHADSRRVINGNTVQTETAWIQGQDLPGSNWAMAASYCSQSCVVCEYTTYATTLKAEVKQICGQILVTNDADSLRVTYNMFDGWKLRKAQIYLGSNTGLPINASGYPSYNQFQIIKDFGNGVTGTVQFSYALSSLPTNYVIATRAETERFISGSPLWETAWGFGDPFVNSTDWGWTIPYSTQVCNQ